jgi:hypothetical protein
VAGSFSLPAAGINARADSPPLWRRKSGRRRRGGAGDRGRNLPQLGRDLRVRLRLDERPAEVDRVDRRAVVALHIAHHLLAEEALDLPEV